MSDAGADAVLVITPCFYKNAMNNDALYKHFYTVSITVQLNDSPVFLLNHHSLTKSASGY